MSISSIGSSVPHYQAPATSQIKDNDNDERTESQSVRNQEAESSKEAAGTVKSSNIVDVKA